MKHLLNKAQVQHQEVSRAVALLSHVNHPTAEALSGDQIALALIAALPEGESSADVAELLFTALCDLMPAPAWGEVDAAIARLCGFAQCLAPIIFVRRIKKPMSPDGQAMIKTLIVQATLSGNISEFVAQQLIQEGGLSHA